MLSKVPCIYAVFPNRQIPDPKRLNKWLVGFSGFSGSPIDGSESILYSLLIKLAPNEFVNLIFQFPLVLSSPVIAVP